MPPRFDIEDVVGAEQQRDPVVARDRLEADRGVDERVVAGRRLEGRDAVLLEDMLDFGPCAEAIGLDLEPAEIGRASCRERVYDDV